MTDEERHCKKVAEACKGEFWEDLAYLLLRERAAARAVALEQAAAACEKARPAGGRAWSNEQAACYEALTHVADYIRALITKSSSEGEP